MLRQLIVLLACKGWWLAALHKIHLNEFKPAGFGSRQLVSMRTCFRDGISRTFESKPDT